MKKIFFAVSFIVGVVVGGATSSLICKDQFLRQEERRYRPLIKHTVSRGDFAEVVYIEKWSSTDAPSGCQSFELVWPDNAYENFVHYMLAVKNGEVEHKYELIGYWKSE